MCVYSTGACKVPRCGIEPYFLYWQRFKKNIVCLSSRVPRDTKCHASREQFAKREKIRQCALPLRPGRAVSYRNCSRVLRARIYTTTSTHQYPCNASRWPAVDSLMRPDDFRSALLLLLMLKVSSVVIGVTDNPHEQDAVDYRKVVTLLDELIVVGAIATTRGLWSSI